MHIDLTQLALHISAKLIMNYSRTTCDVGGALLTRHWAKVTGYALDVTIMELVSQAYHGVLSLSIMLMNM